METSNINLKKFDLQNDPNASMNLETYFNNNWDIIDAKTFELADKLNIKSSELDTKIDTRSLELNAKINEVATTLTRRLENSNSLSFNGIEAVNSFPNGAKGLFSPRIEGVKPLVNKLGDSNKACSVDLARSSSWITLKQDGSLRIDFSGTDSKYFNAKVGRKYFIKYKVKSSSTTQLANLAVYQYGGNDITLSTTTGYEIMGIYTPPSDTKACPFIRASGVGQIDFEYAVAYDITGLPTELQTVQYCNSFGYKEPFAVPSQSYDLVSRGNNLFDSYNFEQSNADIKQCDDGWFELTAKNSAWGYVSFDMQVDPNTNYTIKSEHQHVSGASVNYVNIYAKDSAGEYSLLGSSQISNKKINTGFLQIRAYASATSLGSAVNRYRISVANEASSTYIPHTSSTATFTVPEEYPLVELPNGAKNVSDGDYGVSIEFHEIVDEDIISIAKGANNDIIRMSKPANFVGKGATMYDENYVLEGFDFSTVHHNNRDKSENIGKVSARCSVDEFYVFVQKDTYADKAKAQEGLRGKKLIYQLANPITLKDGEQGYKAPTSIQAYENGDLVVQGIYEEIHQTSSTDNKTIELNNDLLTLKGVYTIDGDELEAQLQSDSKTIMLTEASKDKVLVKGLLKQSTYLYPKIKGNLPANLGTLANNNSKALSETNEKIAVLEDQIDFCVDFIKKLNTLVNSN